MQDGRLARTVSIAFWIFLVLSFSQAYGEKLFRWTDDTGRPCYSNVSPPAGMKAYSVATVSHLTVDPSSLEQASADNNAAEKKTAETDGAHSDFSEVFLKQRIMDRKTSIGHIEALLQKHPGDPVLRKSLFKKKRYLLEDLTRLKKVR